MLDRLTPSEPVGHRLSRVLARVVGLRYVKARNEKPLLSVTFDDIPETAASEGARILEDHGARGTFYVAGGLSGALEGGCRMADANACADLHRRGHEIGCHTYSHRRVGTFALDELRADLERNQAFLAQYVPELRLRNFALPYNQPTLTAKFALQRRFASCRGGLAGINSGFVDLGYLRAVGLNHDTEASAVRAWIETAVRERGWLVLFTHDVSEQPSRFGCTPGLLETTLATANRLGTEVVTVGEALKRLRGSMQGEPRAR